MSVELDRINRALRRLQIFWRIWTPLMVLGTVVAFMRLGPTFWSFLWLGSSLLSAYHVVRQWNEKFGDA